MIDLADGAGQARGAVGQHAAGFAGRLVGFAQAGGHIAVGFGDGQCCSGDAVEGDCMALGNAGDVLDRAGDIDQVDAQRGCLLGKTFNDAPQGGGVCFRARCCHRLPGMRFVVKMRDHRSCHGSSSSNRRRITLV